MKVAVGKKFEKFLTGRGQAGRRYLTYLRAVPFEFQPAKIRIKEVNWEIVSYKMKKPFRR